MRIVDYRAVSAATARSLNTLVAGLLEEGWEPLGGVSCAKGNGFCVVIQAMVRRHNEA